MAATDESVRRLHKARAAAFTVVVVAVVAVVGAFALGEIRDAAAGPDASAPSCSWPARIEHANSDQAGLIRCYLRAVAHHSASELRAVVRAIGDNGPTGFLEGRLRPCGRRPARDGDCHCDGQRQ